MGLPLFTFCTLVLIQHIHSYEIPSCYVRNAFKQAQDPRDGF